MASTSETYMSGFGQSDTGPLFRHSQHSQSIASMSPYSEKTDPSNISQLALPAARPMARDPSPASSDSGGHHMTSSSHSASTDPNRLPPAPVPVQASYPYGYPTSDSFRDDHDAPILSGFPVTTADQYHAPPAQVFNAIPTQAQQQYQPAPAQAPVQVYPVAQAQAQPATSTNRGVSLVDSGPVPAAPHDPVRRVSRHQRRSSSRNQLVSPITTSSQSSHLPPGAVSRFHLSYKSRT